MKGQSIVLNKSNDLKAVEIYTYSLYLNSSDVSCIWTALVTCNGIYRLLSGKIQGTVKSQADKYTIYAELYSIYAALKILKEPCSVHIYSTCQFIANAINLNWIDHWKTNGWRIHGVGSVPNTAVWHLLLPILETHDTSIEWVRFPDDISGMAFCKNKAERVYDSAKTYCRYDGNMRLPNRKGDTE